MSQAAPYRPVMVVAGQANAVSTAGKPGVSPGLFRAASIWWWGACVVIPLCVLLEPVVGGPIFLPIVMSGLIIFPCSGVVLLAGLIMGREPDRARTFLGAGLGLGVCVALLGPAGRTGVELAYGSRLAELDALARAVEADFARADGDPQRAPWAAQSVSGAFQLPMRRLGLRRVNRIREGLLFSAGGFDSSTLLYAGAASDPAAPACLDVRATLLGGRWYVWHCARMARDTRPRSPPRTGD